MHKIETELVKATRYRAKGKTGQDLYKDLIEATQKLSDDAWDGLSTPAQIWVNKGVQAIQADKPVPKFNSAAEEDDDDDKPAAKRAKGKAAKASRTIDAPRATAQTIIKQLVLRNLDISTDEIIEKMQKAGYEPTRFFVATTKSNFKHALKVIKAENVDVRKLDI